MNFNVGDKVTLRTDYLQNDFGNDFFKVIEAWKTKYNIEINKVYTVSEINENGHLHILEDNNNRESWSKKYWALYIEEPKYVNFLQTLEKII